VNDHLEGLAGDGVEAVVMAPIGFVSDHMEVMYDLDTEAAATAERLGLAYRRASTPGVHPAFVSVARELLVERAVVESGRTVGRATVGSSPPSWDVCQPDCCPNLREKRPALCESDQ
jgi:ferrochelatase